MKESDSTTQVVSDREAIADLINKWVYYRDQGHWSQLRTTFHSEGTISLSWFSGPFEQFVEAWIGRPEKGGLSQHRISTPLIRINGNRAVSEVSVTIMFRGGRGPIEVDVTSYARFYDLLEKREGTWRIVKRTAIYEKDRMDPVRPSLIFWFACLFTNFKKYPAPYRYLAYSLESTGFKLAQNIVTDKSKEADLLYKVGEAWLSS